MKDQKKMKMKTIKLFLEKGGYDIIENQNPSGWVNPKTGKVWYRLFTELKEKTGLCKPTCMAIQRFYPTRKDAETILDVKPKIVSIKDYTEGVWISKRDIESVMEAYLQSEKIEKLAKRIDIILERYIVIDTMAYRMRKAFREPDLTVEKFLTEEFNRQLESSGKRVTDLESLLTELSGQLHGLWVDLHLLNNSVRERIVKKIIKTPPS